MIVRKHDARTGQFVAHITLTDQLAQDIAGMNGLISTDKVKVALADGMRVYTNFTYYQREIQEIA